ncbi:MAG: hypothetical protein AABX85_01410 [Nanoarchaeota archaeon]
MKVYDEANIERIEPILASLVEHRKGLGAKFEEIFKGFDEKWGYGSMAYVYNYVRHYLESPVCWNRLIVDKKQNIRGRNRLIERIHEYMDAIKYPAEKREQFFRDIAWLHKDIIYSGKKQDERR